MPQANSTISMPRATSPCASVNTLPCSAVIARARSSRCLFSSSKNLNITRARRIGGVSDHAANAARALCTAASISEAFASAMRPVTRPVAGLNTSEARTLCPLTTLPEIQWSMEVMEAALEILSGVFMAGPALRRGKYLNGAARQRPCDSGQADREEFLGYATIGACQCLRVDGKRRLDLHRLYIEPPSSTIVCPLT